MSKVYITNFTGHGYKPAEAYGDLVFITHGFVDFKDITNIRERIHNFIKDASPNDYLLLSGNNLLCSIATHDWINIHKVCKILHWNSLKKQYDLYSIQ